MESTAPADDNTSTATDPPEVVAPSSSAAAAPVASAATTTAGPSPAAAAAPEAAPVRDAEESGDAEASAAGGDVAGTSVWGSDDAGDSAEEDEEAQSPQEQAIRAQVAAARREAEQLAAEQQRRRELTAQAVATMAARIVGHESQTGKAHHTRVGKATLPDKYWVFLIETTLGPDTCGVYRRYSEFVELHHMLRREWISVPARLPTKHRTRTQDNAFAARRACELDQYLVELFRSPEARTCRHIQQFLNLPSAVQAPEVSVYFPPIT